MGAKSYVHVQHGPQKQVHFYVAKPFIKIINTTQALIALKERSKRVRKSTILGLSYQKAMLVIFPLVLVYWDDAGFTSAEDPGVGSQSFGVNKGTLDSSEEWTSTDAWRFIELYYGKKEGKQQKYKFPQINLFALGFSKSRSFQLFVVFLLHVVVESVAFQHVRIVNTLNKWHVGKIKYSFLDTASKQG